MPSPSDNVIRHPWRVSLGLPKGSQLWNVEGVPVAVIPNGAAIPQVLAFDSPVPRPFSNMAVVRFGKAMTREDWDQLVNTSRAQRPASRPPRK